jgi:hypothetical protein
MVLPLSPGRALAERCVRVLGWPQRDGESLHYRLVLRHVAASFHHAPQRDILQLQPVRTCLRRRHRLHQRGGWAPGMQHHWNRVPMCCLQMRSACPIVMLNRTTVSYSGMQHHLNRVPYVLPRHEVRNVLLCMPNRTNCILFRYACFVSLLPLAAIESHVFVATLSPLP